MQSSRSALLLAAGAVAAVAAVAACGDPVEPNRFDNQNVFPVVYAMTGTPPSLPSGFGVRAGFAVRIDPSWAFDVAFDMTDQGDVQVLSAKSIATELTPVNRVGFLFTNAGFDEVTAAPTTGYAYDTTVTLPVGRVMLIDVFDASCQGQFTGTNIRGKMMIDSVNVVSRAIYVHLLANRNCGLKSLVEGRPKD